MLRWLFLGFLVSTCVYAQLAGYEVIKADGRPEMYVLHDGLKYHIENPSWLGPNGLIDAPVRILTQAEVEAIPESYPLPEGSGLPGKAGTHALDGMLLTDKVGRIYVVDHGIRHWILDNRWIIEGPYAKKAAIHLSDAQLEAIPLGGSITYTPKGAKIALPLLAAALLIFFIRGRNLKDNLLIRVALAAVFIAAIGLREPYLLQHPRFWAEEGLVYFQFGTTHSILRTLFYVYTPSNYLSLATNIAAILSSRTAFYFGLLYAPIASTLFGYAIQALTMVAILFVKSRLFDCLWKAVAGCMIVIFAPTATDEIWLNSLHSMSFLGVIALVLLFAEMEGWPKWVRWGARATLLFCGLSSPYALALLPVFLILAWRTKDRERKVQCVILTACVLLQVGVAVKTRIMLVKKGVDPMRATGTLRADASAVNIFSEHMLYPALGFSLRERVLDITGLKEASFSAASFPPRPLMQTLRPGGWLAFLLLAGVLALLRGPALFSDTNMVWAAFAIMAIFTCVTALYSAPTGRYAFMPGVLFLLLLMANIEAPKGHVYRFVCMATLAWGLAAGMVAYTVPKFQEGPAWEGEVKKWEADPSYSLRVWPSFFVREVNITYPKVGSHK
jgi:hypothetical protein